MKRTNPPNFYLSPNKREMREMAEQLEIKKYAPDFVEDIANIAAGGEFVEERHLSDEIRAQVTKDLEGPDKDNEWRFSGRKKNKNRYGDNESWTKSRSKVIDYRTDNVLKYNRNVSDFIRNLDLPNIPGRSPLEQAMNVLKMLSNVEGGTPGKDGETLPIFTESDTDGNQTAKKLNELIESVDSLDDAEKSLIEEDDSEPSDSSGVGSSDDLQKMSLANDMLKDGKLIWLKVSRNLDTSAKMQVRKSVKLVPDREGDEIRVRPIDNFGELPKIQVAEYALPKTFRMYRAAAKVAPIRERVRRDEKQQLLYLLIDSSGSMKESRIYQAGGVLMNRLKAVITGDAQVYVRFFDEKLHAEHFADTPEKAKALMQQFREENFSGGGTDIVNSMKGVQERIEEILKESRSLTRPELVVVTDGEDSNVSSLDYSDFAPTTVHAFVIDNKNTELSDFARSTGGVGVNVNSGEDSKEIPF